MKLLEIVHPAAKSLVDVSLAQDAEVGDGTTSVVILAGEFLKEAKPYVEEGVHPRVRMETRDLPAIDPLALGFECTGQPAQCCLQTAMIFPFAEHHEELQAGVAAGCAEGQGLVHQP